MNSVYFDYLYPETKELLKHHDLSVHLTVLSRFLKRAKNIARNLLTKFREDLLFLSGYSHNDFSIATTKSVSLICDSYIIHQNSDEHFGHNKLSFDIPLHPVSDHPCVVLTYNRERRKSTGVSLHVPKTVIKDNNMLRYSSFYTYMIYSPKLNNIGESYTKSKSRHLFYFKDSKNITAFLNNKKIYNLKKHDFTEKDFETFRKECLKFDTSLNAHCLNQYQDLHSFVRHIKNPMWRDLNAIINVDTTKRLPVRYHRLSYMYKKYGTNKLRELYFNTNKKSIQRVLMKSTSLVSIYKSLLELSPSFVSLDINHQVEFLDALSTHPRIQMNHAYAIRTAHSFNYLISNGISIKRLNNMLKSGNEIQIFLDIFNYTHLTFEESDINLKDTLKGIHDKLVQRERRVKNAAYYNREIPLTETESKWNQNVNGFEFRVSTNTDDLDELGTVLSICVRSYDKAAISKRTTIVGVYSEAGDPICCIEVNPDFRIVQAKQYRNHPAKHSEILYKAIIDWAKTNKLDTKGSYDLT